MFPTPMNIDQAASKKRGRELTLRPDRELPVAKIQCVEPLDPYRIDPEREPFIFFPISPLIRSVNVE